MDDATTAERLDTAPVTVIVAPRMVRALSARELLSKLEGNEREELQPMMRRAGGAGARRRSFKPYSNDVKP